MNGLRCKCGRFLKASELKCGRCRTNEFIKELIQAFDHNIPIANHTNQPIFISHFVRPNPVKPPKLDAKTREELKSSSGFYHERRDFKTGDVWEEGKKEKDAVRKYAEERDREDREYRREQRIISNWMMVLTYIVGVLAGGGCGYLIWGIR